MNEDLLRERLQKLAELLPGKTLVLLNSQHATNNPPSFDPSIAAFHLPIALSPIKNNIEAVIEVAIQPPPETDLTPWLTELSKAWILADGRAAPRINKGHHIKSTMERTLLRLTLEQWLSNALTYRLSFPDQTRFSLPPAIQRWWTQNKPVLIALAASHRTVPEQAISDIFGAYTDSHALYIRLHIHPEPSSNPTTPVSSASAPTIKNVWSQLMSSYKDNKNIAVLFIPLSIIEQGEGDVHDYLHGLSDAWVQEGYEKIRLIYAPPVQDINILPSAVRDLLYSMPLAESIELPLMNWQKNPLGWLIAHLSPAEYDYVRALYRPVFEILNDLELRQTLLTFIHHQGHIGETADALYLHRNTLLYRLDRIRKLSGLDPRRLDDLFLLYFILNVFNMKIAPAISLDLQHL